MSLGARIAKAPNPEPAATALTLTAAEDVPFVDTPKRRASTGHVLVAGFDVVALLGAGMLTEAGLTWVAVYTACTLAVGLVQRVYSARITLTLHDAIPAAFSQAAVPSVVLGPIAAAQGAESVLWLPLSAFLALIVARWASGAVVRTLRRRGRLLDRALIVGAGSQAAEIARTLREHREYGIEPVGFVDDCRDELDPPILGPVDELMTLLDSHAANRVLIAYGTTPDPRLVQVIRMCDTRHIDVHVLPRMFELGVTSSFAADAEEIWGIPLVRVRRPAHRRASRMAKRGFDVAFASLALLLLSPVMLVCTVLVRLSGPGPILFRQKRVGHDGRLFEVLKFRTMPVNEDSDSTWNVDDDERMTRIGRFLRRTTLDELPQLVNVLRGEMAIVGPRPERPRFVAEFEADIPHYGDRHRVPGGLTGWAQAHNLRGNTSIEERTRFDNYYIEHWSLWRDVVTLFKTVAAVFRGPK